MTESRWRETSKHTRWRNGFYCNWELIKKKTGPEQHQDLERKS